MSVCIHHMQQYRCDKRQGRNSRQHSEYPWWRHQMETFAALLVLCEGNSPVTGEFLSQRPVMWSFDVFFDLRLNKWLSKQSWGWWFETQSRSLWRHCNVIKRINSFGRGYFQYHVFVCIIVYIFEIYWNLFPGLVVVAWRQTSKPLTVSVIVEIVPLDVYMCIWSCFPRISTLPRVYTHYSDVTWASRHEQHNCLFNSFFSLTAEIRQGSALYWPFVRGMHRCSLDSPPMWGKFPCHDVNIVSGPCCSLRPSDAIWRQGSRSTLVQVMACCLTAPSHYLNQYWLIISEVQRHSPGRNFMRNVPTINR